MADHRFPQLGTDGYVSPYLDVTYSKGPKVIYGDTDVFRVVLNDPQTDVDDEWGRTEHISLRQLVDEAITVRKALFGWSSIRGLTDEWDYFETNLFDIDYNTPSDSILSIGNTSLQNGQLTIASGTSLTATQFLMSSSNFNLQTEGTFGMRLNVGGGSYGGSGKVSMWFYAAEAGDPNSAAALVFRVNSATYTFTDTAFSVPSGAAFSAGSTTFTSVTTSDLTVSNSASLGTGTGALSCNVTNFSATASADFNFLQGSGSFYFIANQFRYTGSDNTLFRIINEVLTYAPKGGSSVFGLTDTSISIGSGTQTLSVAASNYSLTSSILTFGNTSNIYKQITLDSPGSKITEKWHDVISTGNSSEIEWDASGKFFTYSNTEGLVIRSASFTGVSSTVYGNGSIKLNANLLGETLPGSYFLSTSDVNGATDPHGLVVSILTSTGSIYEGFTFKSIPVYMWGSSNNFLKLTYNSISLTDSTTTDYLLINDTLFKYSSDATNFFQISGNTFLFSPGAPALSGTSTAIAIGPGVKFLLGNAYTAGAPSATGYLVIADSSGTEYKIPAEAL